MIFFLYSFILSQSLVGHKSNSRSRQIAQKYRLPLDGNRRSIQCDICTKAVEYIEECLKDQQVEEEIIAAIDDLCVQYPSPYDQYCLTAVKQYVPTIIQYIEQGLESSNICSVTGLCSIHKSHRPVVLRRYQPKAQKGDSDACTICTITVNYIDQLMRDKQVEEEIIGKVDNFCSTLSWLYKTVCKMIAKQYVPSIMALIDEGVTTLDICHHLTLCNSTTISQRFNIRRVPSTQLRQAKLPNGLCDTCQNAIDQAKALLSNGTYVDEITQQVKQFCAALESPLADACETYVDTYFPLILSLIESGLETLDICKKIGLCAIRPRNVPLRRNFPMKHKIDITPYIVSTTKGSFRSIQCDICTKAVEYIEECLKDQQVEEEIIAAIDDLCIQYPAPYDQRCIDLVKQYVPIIIQYIEQGLESANICSITGLCSTRKTSRPLAH